VTVTPDPRMAEVVEALVRLVREEVREQVERVRSEVTAPAAALGDRSLNTREAAAFLGYSPLTLRQWRHLGEGPPHLGAGRRVRYLQSDLDRWRASERRGR
jgi:predicted DNA-binding transcriptional regulator AlpA